LDRKKLSVKEERREEVRIIPIDLIEPDPEQPRKSFDEEKIRELADSIKYHGLLQPILVRPNDGKYQIVHGERRYRACKLVGLTELRCIVKDLTDDEKLEIQLIENLQREDLNPIEEAEAFKKLIERYGYTHEQLAAKIGKSREYVSNKVRLLKLPRSIQEALVEGVIAEGHARAVVGIETREQKRIIKQVIEKKLTVRETEEYVRSMKHVSRETSRGVTKRTLLIPISSKIYDDVYKVARKLRIKPEELIERAIVDFLSQERSL